MTLLDKTVEDVQDEATYGRFLKHYTGIEPDAYLFVTSWCVYTHAIDDIIDGDNTDPMFILKTFELAAMLYANMFYLQHLGELRPLMVMTSSTYMTSVTLEREPTKELWKTRVADALRQNGNEVILAVIQILHGVDVRIKASYELRELAWRMHHDKEGNPR